MQLDVFVPTALVAAVFGFLIVLAVKTLLELL